MSTKMYSTCKRCEGELLLVAHPAQTSLFWIHTSTGNPRSDLNGAHNAKDFVDLKKRVVK